MGLRLQKKERVRERIIEVCEALFRERGFDETTVDEVIRQVEISKQTFFNYFPGKEAVLTELGLRWIAAQAESPQQGTAVAESRRTGILEGTREATRRQLRAIQDDAAFARLLFTRSGFFFGQGGSPGRAGGAALARRSRVMFEAVAELLRIAQKTGELRPDVDALQAAEIYVSTMVTTARFWLTDYWETDEDLEERGMKAADIILEGLVPRTAPSDDPRGPKDPTGDPASGERP